jgi:hypothetical protein
MRGVGSFSVSYLQACAMARANRNHRTDINDECDKNACGKTHQVDWASANQSGPKSL